MNQFGYIYRTTDLINGTVYIGQRIGEFQPWYFGSGVLIRRAVAKHGKENFLVEFVQSAFNREELDRLEIVFIAEARIAGRTYNIRDGGLGSLWGGKGVMTGRRHSEKTRRQMSESHSGERNHFFGRGDLLGGPGNPRFGAKLSEETKRKIGQSNRLIRGEDHGNFGKVRSAETRAKISASKSGKSVIQPPMTEATKVKISIAAKAKFARGWKVNFTPEIRQKISEGRKRFWAEKKRRAESCA